MAFVIRVKNTHKFLCKDRKSFKHAIEGPIEKALVYREADCLYQDDLAEDEEAVEICFEEGRYCAGHLVKLPKDPPSERFNLQLQLVTPGTLRMRDLLEGLSVESEPAQVT